MFRWIRDAEPRYVKEPSPGPFGQKYTFGSLASSQVPIATNSPSPVPNFLSGNSPTPVSSAPPEVSDLTLSNSSSTPSLMEVPAPPRAPLPTNPHRLLFQEDPTPHVPPINPPADPTDFDGIRRAAPFPPKVPNITQRRAHWTDASAKAFLQNNANVDFGYLLPHQQRAYWLGWCNSENTESDAAANGGHHWFIDMTNAEWHQMRHRRYQIPLPPNLNLTSRF